MKDEEMGFSVDEMSKYMNERNDCAVRAVAHASGVRYTTVHGMFKSRGRSNRGRSAYTASDWVMGELGMKMENVTSQVRARAKTVRTASRILTKGTYIVCTRGHMLCIKDGEVRDWADGRQLRIRTVYRVLSVAGVNTAPDAAPQRVPATPAIQAPKRVPATAFPKRRGTVKQQIRATANRMWTVCGQPRTAKELLKLRKEIMNELEAEGVKRTSASTELGNWQKTVIAH